MKSLTVTIVSLVLIAGCGSVSTHEIRHAPEYEPTTVEDVTVYEDAANMPCRTQDRLAVITVEDMAILTSREELYTKLKEEAAKVGANAVFISYAGTVGSGGLGLNSESSVDGTAVRMTCESSVDEDEQTEG